MKRFELQAFEQANNIINFDQFLSTTQEEKIMKNQSIKINKSLKKEITLLLNIIKSKDLMKRIYVESEDEILKLSVKSLDLVVSVFCPFYKHEIAEGMIDSEKVKNAIKTNYESEFELSDLDQDFDYIKQVNGEKKIFCKHDIDQINHCLYATSKGGTRKTLENLHIESDFVEAIDGHRLERRKLLNDNGFNVLIDNILWSNFAKFNSKGFSKFSMKKEEKDSFSYYQIETNLIQIKFRQSESLRFPDCNTIIPTDMNYFFECNRLELMSKINEACLLIEDKKLKPIKLIANKDSLGIIGENNVYETKLKSEYSTNIDLIPQEASKDFCIGFNGRYVLEMLKEQTGDKVRLHVKDFSCPVIVKTNESDSVLMPLRIEW